MINEEKATKTTLAIDEDEIFKSLSHKIRRDIIRTIGDQGKLTFSIINKQIGGIDSPTLSYHLKSLHPLLNTEDNKYELTEIGKSAYNLLIKTDQSHKISKYQKRFIYAYIVTVICWISVQTLIPMLIGYVVPTYYIIIIIILNTVAIINYIAIWKLKNV